METSGKIVKGKWYVAEVGENNTRIVYPTLGKFKSMTQAEHKVIYEIDPSGDGWLMRRRAGAKKMFAYSGKQILATPKMFIIWVGVAPLHVAVIQERASQAGA